MVKFAFFATILLSILFIGIRLKPQPHPRVQPTPTIDILKQTISRMSREEKIGQMFMIGFEGATISGELRSFLTTHKIGGVILFSKNIQTPQQLRALTRDLKALATTYAPTVPFLIAIDEEGGPVTRIPWKHEDTGQSVITSSDEAYRVAKKRAQELLALGITTILAPVVERSEVKGSFIERQNRAFRSRDRRQHQELVQAMIDGYHDGGILSVPKHYPGGLGYVKEDPHQKLPIISEKGREALLTDVSLFASFGKKAGAIMITHLLYPTIASTPASLSPVFITDMLKKEHQFDGVVISDDLAMGAVTEGRPSQSTLSTTIYNGIGAGLDMVIISTSQDVPLPMVGAAVEHLTQGAIPQDRLDDAVSRSVRFKGSFDIIDK